MKVTLIAIFLLSLSSQSAEKKREDMNSCEDARFELSALLKAQNDLPHLGGAGKKTLKDLKKDYDDSTAKLVLMRGVAKIRDDYDKVSRQVKNDFENIISESFDKTKKGLEDAKKVLNRVETLEAMVLYYLDDINKSLSNTSVKIDYFKGSGGFYPYFKSLCSKGLKIKLQGITKAKVCKIFSEGNLEKNLFKKLSKAYNHINETGQAKKKILQRLAQKLLPSDYLLNNLLPYDKYSSLDKDTPELDKKKKETIRDLMMLTDSTEFKSLKVVLNVQQDKFNDLSRHLKEFNKENSTDLEDKKKSLTKLVDKCLSERRVCEISDSDIKRSIKDFFGYAKEASENMKKQGIFKDDKLISQSDAGKLLSKIKDNFERLASEGGMVKNKAKLLETVQRLSLLGHFKENGSGDLSKKLDEYNRELASFVELNSGDSNSCSEKEGIFKNKGTKISYNKKSLSCLLSHLDDAKLDEKLAQLEIKRAKDGAQIADFKKDATYDAYETLKQFAFEGVERFCHYGEQEIQTRIVNCNPIGLLEGTPPLKVLSDNAGSIIASMDAVKKDLERDWTSAKNLCEMKDVPFSDDTTKADIFKNSCKKALTKVHEATHGTKAEQIENFFNNNYVTTDRFGERRIVKKDSWFKVAGFGALGALTNIGFPLLMTNQSFNYGLDYQTDQALYNKQFSHLLTSGQVGPNGAIDPFGYYGVSNADANNFFLNNPLYYGAAAFAFE